MTWPAPDLPIGFSNEDAQVDLHPDAHNQTNATLNSDYRPQISANKSKAQQNANDISTLTAAVGAVDDAWQANETARNLDFMRGNAPRVVAGSAYEITLEGKAVRRQSTGGVHPGTVKSTDVQTVLQSSDKAVGTGWTTLAQATLPTGAAGNTIWLVTFSADLTCGSNGLVSLAVKTNGETEPPASSRAVWSTDFAARNTLTGHRTFQSGGGFTFYLQAKGNRATFTAAGQNTHMTIIALHN